MSQEIQTARGTTQVLNDAWDTHLSAVFSYTKRKECLRCYLTLYLDLVVWLREVFCNTQTAANFGDIIFVSTYF